MKFCGFAVILIILCLYLNINYEQQLSVYALRYIKSAISQTNFNLHHDKHNVKAYNSINDCDDVDENKIKVLCLHGYLTNSLMFQHEMKSITENASKYAEFTFLNAANKFSLLQQNKNISISESRSKYRWWDVQEIACYNKYNGLHESLLLLNDVEKTTGPYDIIISHCQGACLNIIIDIINQYPDILNELDIKTNENKEFSEVIDKADFKLPKPDLRIIIGGFLPRDDSFRNVIEDLNLVAKSLHIYSINDDVVVPEQSIKALSAYQFPGMIVHDSNRHNLPLDEHVSDIITNNIYKVWKKKFNKTIKIILEQ